MQSSLASMGVLESATSWLLGPMSKSTLTYPSGPTDHQCGVGEGIGLRHGIETLVPHTEPLWPIFLLHNCGRTGPARDCRRIALLPFAFIFLNRDATSWYTAKSVLLDGCLFKAVSPISTPTALFSLFMFTLSEAECFVMDATSKVATMEVFLPQTACN